MKKLKKIQDFLLGDKYGRYLFLGTLVLSTLLFLLFYWTDNMIFIYLQAIPSIYITALIVIFSVEFFRICIYDPIKNIISIIKHDD